MPLTRDPPLRPPRGGLIRWTANCALKQVTSGLPIRSEPAIAANRTGTRCCLEREAIHQQGAGEETCVLVQGFRRPLHLGRQSKAWKAAILGARNWVPSLDTFRTFSAQLAL